MPQPRGLCRSTLREALRQNTSQAHAFDASLQMALSQASLGTAAELTRVVHDCCVASFRPEPAPRHPELGKPLNPDWRLNIFGISTGLCNLTTAPIGPLGSNTVIGDCWHTLSKAFRRHAAFRKCQTTLKQRGKARRKAIIDEVLQEAAKAASAGDMHALYSHIRRIAPKTSRERIQIRGPDNEILAPQKEYEHIYQYFSKLYSQGPCNRDVEYQLQQDYADNGR